MVTIGNYRVGRKIGEGGFGRVYEAEHVVASRYSVLGKKAMACVKQNIHATKTDADLLVYEFELLWDLDNHHSIPSMKDIFRLDENTTAIVMDHITGPTLEEIVSKNGRLHPEDACWITERLLNALRFINYYGIVHSDVKPQNVFVETGKKSDIKLIDFGLATYKPKSGTRARGYTPGYAAPELMNGGTPIPETDIYGAGIVMMRALGGDIAKKRLPDDVPEDIAELCNLFLKYDPKERPIWEREDPLEKLGDIREKVFGRRHRH